MFREPQVASVGTTRGDHVVTGVHRIDGRRLLTSARRPERLGTPVPAAGTNESVIVVARALGPVTGE